MSRPSKDNCASCVAGRQEVLRRLNLDTRKVDHVIALAGNPNTGKSTLFNALTGLRQHTGNWPGKTITRAEGAFVFKEKYYKLVDLPGTYSLHSCSPDEEVARDFILNGQPDLTLVVCDATALTRNLNLVIQIRQITGQVIVALNLMDEARSSGYAIDVPALSEELGVPVIPIVARRGEGIDNLLECIHAVASRSLPIPAPLPVRVSDPALERSLRHWKERAIAAGVEGNQAEWVALRLMQGDAAPLKRHLDSETSESMAQSAQESIVLEQSRMDDAITTAIYADADAISSRVLQEEHGVRYLRLKSWLDGLLLGKWTGIPIMALVFAVVIWLTILGANVPSSMLAQLLVEQGHPWLKGIADALGVPSMVSGLLIDGMYLTCAWVVSVMLPPMAIFFPLFTILEDFGYLPRVAFNLDGLFRRAGGHGKQALTMAMGYGCNAAGVIAARIIESPRERLIAIITNNFALCNGRWPTQILMATLFVGTLVSAHYASFVAATAVVFVAGLGVVLTFLSSWLLSKTVLKGIPASFTLELPPYRPPQILQTLYKSLIDRTFFVLARAVLFAVPAGAVIWIISHWHIGGVPLALHVIDWLEPSAYVMGLTGVILVAYVVAIPANEIVIPTILMLTVMQTGMVISGAAGAGVMFETERNAELFALLSAGGWTPLTAICLMVFSLCHNPCSTTIFTIYRETRSMRWTAIATFLPIVYGVVLCTLIAFTWRMVAG